jgi:hypothetical protein
VNEAGLAAIAIFGPVTMALVTWWTARANKREDWDRLDKVAKDLKADNAKVAKRQTEMADSQVSIADQTNKKLDVIHVLVNSSLTAAKQAELNATKRELAMMHEVVDLNRVAGREPPASALAAIESAAKRIAELELEIADRMAQLKESQSIEVKG